MGYLSNTINTLNEPYPYLSLKLVDQVALG